MEQYSKHPLIRTPTGPKYLFEIANVRIIGMILKGNSRKGIQHPFELAKVRIIGRRIITDVDCRFVNDHGTSMEPDKVNACV